jgi:hypothetical protein
MKASKVPQTPADLARRLRRVSSMMINLGVDMTYYGGFNERVVDYGQTLSHSGLCLHALAEHIEEKEMT